MKNVLIIGAAGGIARIVTQNLIDAPDVKLTLLLRHPKKLDKHIQASEQVNIVQADVLDSGAITGAAKGQDVVYANLYGANLGKQAESLVRALDAAGTKRLIWISANGIYGEIPGEYGQWNARMLGSTLTAYAEGARMVEESNLDYTLIRPAWFQDDDEIDYEKTQKGELFKGTEISRKSVADYVTHLIHHPEQDIHASVGISKPNTDGPRPRWY